MSEDEENRPPADEDKTAADHEDAWDTIARRPGFQRLLKAKARFIIPMCAFFLVYYFTLPLMNGLAPEFMAKKVWGAVNIAYLFALSQFFMTWIVAILYARVADKYDKEAHRIVGDLGS